MHYINLNHKMAQDLHSHLQTILYPGFSIWSVCVSHSVPKSFTLSLHDRLHAVEPSRGQEHRD